MGKKNEAIVVQGVPITVSKVDGEARAADIIKNWIHARTTLEFLGTWEGLYNRDFKVVEFDHFKAGLDCTLLY